MEIFPSKENPFDYRSELKGSLLPLVVSVGRMFIAIAPVKESRKYGLLLFRRAKRKEQQKTHIFMKYGDRLSFCCCSHKSIRDIMKKYMRQGSEMNFTAS